jgi:hypothetical protein
MAAIDLFCDTWIGTSVTETGLDFRESIDHRGFKNGDWKFSRPLTGTNQANSERSAHNNGAREKASSETGRVFYAERLVSI